MDRQSSEHEFAEQSAPREADGLFDRALDHMAAGHPEEAVPLLEQVLALAPGHSAAPHALLRSLEDSGRLDEALALARRLTSEQPDDALAHTRLSILLQRLGDIPAAEAAAARAKILTWKRQLREPVAPDETDSI